MNITLIPSQRIYGNHLKKEEIYLHIIPNIFLLGNCIYKYRFPMFFLQPCMDSVNKLGGMPGSGISFKILNIHVVNSSLQNDMIMDKRPSFALGTIIYTYLKFNALKTKEEMLLNATMATAAASYTEGKTKKGEAISGHIEKRTLFKNEQFI